MDNRKWQCGHPNGKYSYLAISGCRSLSQSFDKICRARHHRKSRIWRWNFDVICQSSRDVIISGLGAISIFPVVGHCCTYLRTVFYTYRPLHGLIPQTCRWNFNCTFHSLRDISISGFGRHFRLFVFIQSLLESPRYMYTSCKFSMVE